MTLSATRRHLIALTSVLLVGVGLSTISAPAQASAAKSKPDLGFAIGRTTHADGTWVGRYRVGHQRAYRLQPRKSDVESAYHAVHRVTQVPGRRVAATERAAWILSTYGGTPDRTTAAAVDVAVHALLSRGKWRVGTPYTMRRTNPTGYGHFIRTYARIMLRQSKHRRGPYRASLAATRVPVGNQATVTVKVRNRRGLGPVITGQQRGLAVHVTYPGAKTRTVYLNNHGVGRVYFRAAPGTTRITAAVHAVPDVALFLRRPRNKTASSIAVAAHHRTLRLQAHGLGVSTQSVTVANTSGTVLVGHPLQGTYSVAGLTGHETVDYAVYGPFTTAATSCSGTARSTATAVIGSNDTRPLPHWSPSRTGYYAWQVVAHGNSTTRPASACGTAYLTEKNTRTRQLRVGVARSVRLGHTFGPQIVVSGFDRAEVHNVYTRVYGPFTHKTKAHCTRHRLFRTLPFSIRNNKRWRATTVVNNRGNTGYYVFSTTLAASTFMRSSQSGCGNLMRVTKR